jgi:Xaa-Pro dipeptidase
MKSSRREFLKKSVASVGAMSLGATAACRDAQESALNVDVLSELTSITQNIIPISNEERESRIDKARMLMIEKKMNAIFLESGTSLYYYTGVRWGRSERMFGVVIPARGKIAYIVPKFEHEKAQEVIQIGDDIRTWEEHENPYRLAAQFLKERGITGGSVGIEENVRFFLYDGIRRELPTTQFVSVDPITINCRIIKSQNELALMQRANDITVTAYKAGLACLQKGMTQHEFAAIVSQAFKKLGVRGGVFAQFGEYSAYPHGSRSLQKLKQGDILLMDGGCSVEGYRSDISRTVVFGEPNKRQRKIWNIVKQSQDAALKAAKPGVTCEQVDAAAREVIDKKGFGADYEYFVHRLGHGIGLDGHEWTYLVRGNKTILQPGMCFSNEPGIYIYGEFGVRLEDCMYITEEGAKLFSQQSAAIDKPFV